MNVSFSKNFIKRARKLSEPLRQKVQKKIELFVHNPTHPSLRNHALSGQFKEYRSINITGDLRALYLTVSDTEIVFDEIGTHSQLYT